MGMQRIRVKIVGNQGGNDGNAGNQGRNAGIRMGMTGMWGIRVGMLGSRVGKRVIGVAMRGISWECGELVVGMRGIRVRIFV